LIGLLKQRAIDEGLEKFDLSLSGTCATLVIQLAKNVIVGWAGDSLVSIHNYESRDKFLTVATHRPDDIYEKMRIHKHGGETRKVDHEKHACVFQRGRMFPGLSVTRSLGDLLAHHIGCKSEP
jgi:serine/threonine protein phosphatase PrpC